MPGGTILGGYIIILINVQYYIIITHTDTYIPSQDFSTQDLV